MRMDWWRYMFVSYCEYYFMYMRMIWNWHRRRHRRRRSDRCCGDRLQFRPRINLTFVNTFRQISFYRSLIYVWIWIFIKYYYNRIITHCLLFIGFESKMTLFFILENMNEKKKKRRNIIHHSRDRECVVVWVYHTTWAVDIYTLIHCCSIIIIFLNFNSIIISHKWIWMYNCFEHKMINELMN